jgi:UDP-N-acetyl-D-galactosamine dehydrogenase
MDPYASSEELEEEYGFGLVDRADTSYNAIVVAVAHKEYNSLEESFFADHLMQGGIVCDVKGIYRHKIRNLPYMSL